MPRKEIKIPEDNFRQLITANNTHRAAFARIIGSLQCCKEDLVCADIIYIAEGAIRGAKNKKPFMTRKERIKRILKRSTVGLTCAEITKRVAKAEKLDDNSNVRRYLSGSVSSILKKLVDDPDGVVLVLDTIKGPRGGKVYFGY